MKGKNASLPQGGESREVLVWPPCEGEGGGEFI
jgi:hypothetical protein